MNADDTQKRIAQMCEFIKEEALEKANEIKIKTQEEFELDRQMLSQEGKMKVQEEYEKKEKDLQVQQRIAQSAEIGKQTKRRMVARDDLLNKLYQLAKDRLAELSEKDKEKYTAVLKDLILQGLIKIAEPDIVVRCRKADMEMVRAIIPEVRGKYVKMMKEECGKVVDISVSLNEDEAKMLPPAPNGTPMLSCSGGVIMEGHCGRLVLDNTFDKRLEVCFHDLKPVTRKCLFPSC
jgi:V-type H+-transporting ATPase subunit E